MLFASVSMLKKRIQITKLIEAMAVLEISGIKNPPKKHGNILL
jgi:hypothetical protein